MQKPERISWKDSNLALIGSDLDHKVKAAAADGETAWDGLGTEAVTKIWRIEDFKVVEWPKEKHGKFHSGDSYIILNSYTEEGSDALLHDIHFWIGKESTQDEYGTAAYKTVELDDSLGGICVQHREVQGSESPLFLSYFGQVTYLDGCFGSAESGFTHVEASADQPHLYKVKGGGKGMSMTQVPLSKSSLNQGDSFILFANPSTVWIWSGEYSNRDEKSRSISVAEQMCSEGTLSVIASSDSEGDNPEFWAYLGDGEIQPADDGDEDVQEFVPVLFQIAGDGTTTKVAEGEPSPVRWGRPTIQLDRSALVEDGVFLLNAGFEVYLWMGKAGDKNEKLAGMETADKYMKSQANLADLPLSIVKSGFESSAFNSYFN